jgi:hypothetical protein
MRAIAADEPQRRTSSASEPRTLTSTQSLMSANCNTAMNGNARQWGDTPTHRANLLAAAGLTSRMQDAAAALLDKAARAHRPRPVAVHTVPHPAAWERRQDRDLHRQRTACTSDALEDRRDALPATDAHRHQRITPARAVQFRDRLGRDDRAGRAHRVAQRDA